MRKILFVADWFAEHVNGGGEINNEVLINLLRRKGYTIEKRQSQTITVDFLDENKNAFYIVSNFINLSPLCREHLTSLEYVIYEHDHKYLKSRNPALYKDFKAPGNEVVNFAFYREAKAVLVQSNFHKKIVKLNLGLDNIVNLGGNLWSDEHLTLLRTLGKRGKNDACSVMNSNIEHKNTLGAIKYCEEKEKEYDLIPPCEYRQFLARLGMNRTLVFFPRTPETLSRIIVEARMMGMSVATNALVGATSEEWFKLKGEALIQRMSDKKDEIVEVIEDLVKSSKTKINNPTVSIISTFHKGEKYLESFLDNITNQTIFDDCELILIDANSPGKEGAIVDKYLKKYDNIVYKRFDERIKITPSLNIGLRMARGKYTTFAFIDDVKKNDCIELLLNNITNDDNIDLVYGDVLLTNTPNETYENNTSDGTLFEHSTYEFSKENMIKCLPGPMPLWKMDMHDRNGFFDPQENYADDWEMWLRAVHAGSVFKKIDETVGLYYTGGRSFQAGDTNIKQRQEEAKLFFKYSSLFGKNFSRLRPYFEQYI
tara:strand:+ start:2997 stop:4619 length:1623 start_codon:yes stop_codon:yes gene_type:complete